MSTVGEIPAPRPSGLPRPVLVLIGAAAAAVAVLGLRTMSDLIGPAFLALVLTIAAAPIRRWVVRVGLPGWVGSVLGIVTIYALLLVLSLSLLVAGARFATLIPAYQDELNSELDSLVSWLNGMGVGQDQIQQVLDSFDAGRLVSLAGGVLGGLFGLLSSLFFIITLVLFMVVDASGFTDRLRELPDDRRYFGSALNRFASSTRQYLVVSTVFGFIVAVFDTAALYWIGIPVPLLWGLLSFITNYIPNIGFVIGLLPPAVLGLLEGGVGMMLWVIAVYSILNVLIQTIIQPKIVGDAVGLSATITMLSLVFWAATLGAVGALMAVPLSLLVKALLVDADPSSWWLVPLISGRTADEGEHETGGTGSAPAGAPSGAGTTPPAPEATSPATAAAAESPRGATSDG
jgi:AI-2 transport protein TqsA